MICFTEVQFDRGCGLFELELLMSFSYHIIQLALEPASLPPSFVPGRLAVAGHGGSYSSCSAHALQRATSPDSVAAALKVTTASRFPEWTVGVAVNAHVPFVASDGAAGSLASPFVARFQWGRVVGY